MDDMAGRACCWTTHLVLALVAAARCSAGQQPQQAGHHGAAQPQQQQQQQHSGDAQEQLQALVTRAVEVAAEPIFAELRRQRTLLDSIVSRLDSQDTKLDTLKTVLDALDARLNSIDALNARLVSQNASLDTLKASLDTLKVGQDAVNASLVAALQAPPRDSGDLPTGAGTGIYTLRPGRGGGGLDVDAFCDMDTDGGGWAVFQRRADLLPGHNFFLDWAKYSEGFVQVRFRQHDMGVMVGPGEALSDDVIAGSPVRAACRPRRLQRGTPYIKASQSHQRRTGTG